MIAQYNHLSEVANVLPLFPIYNTDTAVYRKTAVFIPYKNKQNYAKWTQNHYILWNTTKY